MKRLLLLSLFLLLPVLALLPSHSSSAPKSECVNVFFDQGPEGYWMGRTYATFLTNLLGHFPEFQVVVSPIELYREGDIAACRASFYLGSYFENQIPAKFYEEFRTAKKPVMWLGYSIWKLGPALEEIFGYRYKELTTLDWKRKDAKGHPTFFQYIQYKGEEFFKFGDWSKEDPSLYLAPFEQVELDEAVRGKSQLLATARHGADGRVIPYAIRSGNHFYVADIPFSFMHEADRYLVMADLLFDVLGVKAKNEKLALLRIEDVHPFTTLADLYILSAALKRQQVPLNISLVPVFFDPYKTYDGPTSESYISMDRKPEFMAYIREMKADGARFIWHGVTHQYGLMRNPHTGASGDDFEFWNAVDNAPVAEDSAEWVLNRLHDGAYTLDKAGLEPPSVWLTPHYQASALDYLIFARVFPWNIGRVIYFDFKAEGLPPLGDRSLWLQGYDEKQQKDRLKRFSRMKVKSSARWAGQFFPFEIHGDVYGQRLLPENLGNSQPFISSHVIRTRTADDIIRDARRNLVIRNAWASLFYHPYLLQPYGSGGRGRFPGDPAELERILQEIRDMGYRFVDAEDYVKKQNRPLRPEPIYREIKP